MEGDKENENETTVDSTKEEPKKVSPPSTPAPDPTEQESAALVEDDTNEDEDTKQPLLSSGKGKEKAKKEGSRSSDGQKRKKKKRRHHSKEGEETNGEDQKKKRHRKRKPKTELTTSNDPPPEYNDVVAKTDENTDGPSVEFVSNNGVQSTSIQIKEESDEEEAPEIREINESIIKQYGLFAIGSCVFCFFPIGLVALWYAYNSKLTYANGEEQEAYTLIKRSKLFSQIASVVGFLILVLVAIIVMVSKMS